MTALNLSCAELTALYYLRDFQKAAFLPSHKMANWMRRAVVSPFAPFSYSSSGRTIIANLEMYERGTQNFRKPSFNINVVKSSDGTGYRVEEKVIVSYDFGRLLHFSKKRIYSEFSAKEANANKESEEVVLLVPPYSGHFSTLCKDTAKSLLKDHDLYVVDWKNGRDIAIYKGDFTLDDYIQTLMNFIRMIGRRVHVVAVCQPSVPVMATAALMSKYDDPLRPKSMTLMGGPIDTRINPTKVNVIAKQKKLSWFEENVIALTPNYYEGAMRRVCPGFVLLTGFMSLNMERHLNASIDHFQHLVKGDQDSIDAHRVFYNEYRSVLDLPADYFLDSVRIAFQEHSLPQGEMYWKGERVDTKAIRDVALLTVEGEKDDISGVGQTKAAHALCPNLADGMKKHHLQLGVGHYGVFNGRRWREEIAPTISAFIAENSH